MPEPAKHFLGYFTMADQPTIKIIKDGPYQVKGRVPFIEQSIAVNEAGESIEWAQTGEFEAKETMQLCRCGKSGSKPFCDGSHTDGFDGTEVADRRPFAEQAKVLDGPRFKLMDQEDLCALARFCDTHQTVWDEVEKTDDPEVAAIFLDQISDCVSGRLVAIDTQTGEPVLPPRDMRLSTTQDPAEGVSGPLYVEGGIRVVSADGEEYEKRSRMALCRCGKSGNKPFCDGSHVKAGWSDKA
ncbi:CDGSH iron-sulfur domain-containing protein [Paraurantiacibacter namhicola]|uniref:Iron-binding zinc finger CDGSH type n=1 Tax=Paraurantiacibacter namhicola TaxID=645517 RepID=A0A1C7D7W5_9SPHN|nr:CDGSH iron-sulfur domain-containing protein [Paraurantiacibacter namhicola]ANU07442.1 Iron-binding zinc finger CDGSH type [Paraurantiacibacter namhicola]